MSQLARIDSASASQLFELSQSDLEQFAMDGYLVKRKVLSHDLMKRAVDVMWSKMTPSFDRHDPGTWRGTVTDCDGPHWLSARDGKIKLRAEIWGNQIIDNLITHNKDLLQMLEQLLGKGEVAVPEMFRGLYPIFPTPGYEKISIKPHVDFDRSVMPFKVGVVAYLEDVSATGGCFTVWPGSHRALFYACATNSNAAANMTSREFQRHFRDLQREEPVEIAGEAGDVIFFHFCLMHAAGMNVLPGKVRQAVLCNFRTKSCRMDARRPNNIWDGWKGLASLNSPRIRESMRPPSPSLRKRRGFVMANLNVAAVTRHVLRIPIRTQKVKRRLGL